MKRKVHAVSAMSHRTGCGITIKDKCGRNDTIETLTDARRPITVTTRWRERTWPEPSGVTCETCLGAMT